MDYKVVSKLIKSPQSVTTVGIQCKTPYTYVERDLVGDCTGKSDADLIKDVLKVVQTELDPTQAIVDVTQKLGATSAKVESNQELIERVNKLQNILIFQALDNQNLVADIYYQISQLLPKLTANTEYLPGDLVQAGYPSDTNNKIAKGTPVILQISNHFTYTGEPVENLLQQQLATIIVPNL